MENKTKKALKAPELKKYLWGALAVLVVAAVGLGAYYMSAGTLFKGSLLDKNSPSTESGSSDVSGEEVAVTSGNWDNYFQQTEASVMPDGKLYTGYTYAGLKVKALKRVRMQIDEVDSIDSAQVYDKSGNPVALETNMFKNGNKITLNAGQSIDFKYDDEALLTVEYCKVLSGLICQDADVVGTDTIKVVANTINISPAAVSISEANANTTVTVSIKHAVDAESKIPVMVSGTAGLTLDYSLSSELEPNMTTGYSIKIAAGSTSNSFKVTSKEDTLDEDNETVVATLATTGLPTGLALGTTKVSTVTIVDNDTTVANVLSLTATPTTIDESGTTNVSTLKVTAATAVTTATNVPVAFTGTAEAGDYTKAPDQAYITIPAGATEGTMTLTAVHDPDLDNETVTATISAPTGFTGFSVDPAHDDVSVTITDDDVASLVKVKLNMSPVLVYEDPTKTHESTLTASLDTGVLAPAGGVKVDLDFSASGNTAESSDYVKTPDQTYITIAQGQNSGTMKIVVASDPDTADENLAVGIAALPSGYTPDSTYAKVTLTIKDDDTDNNVKIKNLKADPDNIDLDDDNDTEISFEIDKDAYLTVYIEDKDGDEVYSFEDYENDLYGADEYELTWDLEDNDGDEIDEGEYEVIVEAKGKNETATVRDSVTIDVEDSGNGDDDDECDVDYDDADEIDDDELCAAVEWVTDKDIFDGYSDDTFRPDKKINRVELVKVLVEAFDVDEESENLRFTDIDEDAWYISYLETAVANGIVKGDSGKNTFRPGDYVNRVEALKMVFKTLEVTDDFDIDSCNDSPYDDVDEDEWYIDYVCLSADYNDLFDVKNDKFKPAADVTRGEMALLFYRLDDEGVL